jgi:outer membrane protein
MIPLLLGLSNLAFATDSMKIGVLDWSQLLAKAPQAEEAGKRLEREFQAPKDRLVNKQKEFSTKRDKLARDKDILSAADRAKKEKELAKMEQDLRHLDEELRADYSTRHREEMDEFIKTVREVVDKLAKEDQYDLVLPQEATLFVAERIDITEKVLDKLSKAKVTAKADKSSDKKSD